MRLFAVVQTTDAKAPTSMLQELAEQKRTRAMEQSLSAEEIYVATAGAQHIRGVGSSVLLPGSGCVCEGGAGCGYYVMMWGGSGVLPGSGCVRGGVRARECESECQAPGVWRSAGFLAPGVASVCVYVSGHGCCFLATISA